jgi:hypothetical protein
MLWTPLFLAAAFLVVKVVGSYPFPYGKGKGLSMPRDLSLFLLLVALWLVTTLGEVQRISQRG